MSATRKHNEYVIRVKGHLGAGWMEQFDGWSGAWTDDGSTELVGPVADQSALFGILRKLHDLGLVLLSLHCTNGRTSQVVTRGKKS